MREFPSDVAFTPAVKAVQSAKGSRVNYAKAERRGWRTRITPDLAEFVSGLDMFYLGTASAGGQPYIQYRGGNPGFLIVLDDHTLAFADFGGNRQYITVGNLSENPQAFIFLMDYANQQRVKLWGTAKVVEDDPALLERFRNLAYPARSSGPSSSPSRRGTSTARSTSTGGSPSGRSGRRSSNSATESVTWKSN